MESNGNGTGNARPHTALAADVARLLNVARSTVYAWVETTDIPHLRVRGVIRFNLDDVAEWARRQTIAAGGSPS